MIRTISSITWEIFNVQRRRPCLLQDSVESASQKLLKGVIHKVRCDYPNSTWVMVWKNSNKAGITVWPQELARYNNTQGEGEFLNLQKILRDGKLNGCELRGNAETAQFGLVATENLPVNTVVAVECGVVWCGPNTNMMQC